MSSPSSESYDIFRDEQIQPHFLEDFLTDLSIPTFGPCRTRTLQVPGARPEVHRSSRGFDRKMVKRMVKRMVL